MKTPYPLLSLKSGAALCCALAFLIIAAPYAVAQETCAQARLHEQLMAEDDAYRQRHLAFEERLMDILQSDRPEKPGAQSSQPKSR